MRNDQEASRKANDQTMPLNESEKLLMAVLTGLEAEASGATIRQAIEKRVGRSVSLGTIYLLLDRLEAKGCVRSFWQPDTSEEGGLAMRYFSIIQPEE